MKKGTKISLERTWTVGDRIGGGGFGQVYEATDGEESAAIKLVPKDPGAERELLFVELADVRNVVPVVDRGEFKRFWVLVMPRAEMSLRQLLDQAMEPFTPELSLAVLNDLADALVDLSGTVVHRDVKPENVLKLGENWCLADFGISRYAEATTATDTKKFAFSPPYTAPERWRSERATSAADVYSIGIMAFEMLAGHRPFLGRTLEELRDQHLHTEPPPLEGVPAGLAAVVDECLYKAPEARPAPPNLKTRLERLAKPASSGGLARLQDANRIEVRRRAEGELQASKAKSEAGRRKGLAEAGFRSFGRIAEALRSAIADAAPAAHVETLGLRSWSARLSQATLQMSDAVATEGGAWGGWAGPRFDVVAVASLSLSVPVDRHGYSGRSHSLWYCDAVTQGHYSWYETAFMISPLLPRESQHAPFALSPGENAGMALGPGMAEFQVAWPFTELVVGDLNDFVGRWAEWFALASEGMLSRPSTMPERRPDGSWRRS